MTVSYLTTSESTMLMGIVDMFVEQGYPFDPLTTTFNQFLATVLSDLGDDPVSHLRMSETELLTGIVNVITDGSVSHLTTSRAELLALTYNAAAGGGGGGGLESGLIGAWRPGISGVENIVGDFDLVAQGTSTIGSTPEGDGLLANADGEGYRGANVPIQFRTSNAMTLYWRGQIHGQCAGNTGLLAVYYSDPDNAPWLAWAILTGNAGYPNVDYEWNGGGTWTQIQRANVIPSDEYGAMVSLATTWDHPNDQSQFYKNGAPFGSSDFAYAGGGGSETAYLGINLGNVNATCTAAYIWNRALTAVEIAALDANPYWI